MTQREARMASRNNLEQTSNSKLGNATPAELAVELKRCLALLARADTVTYRRMERRVQALEALTSERSVGCGQ